MRLSWASDHADSNLIGVYTRLINIYISVGSYRMCDGFPDICSDLFRATRSDDQCSRVNGARTHRGSEIMGDGVFIVSGR